MTRHADFVHGIRMITILAHKIIFPWQNPFYSLFLFSRIWQKKPAMMVAIPASKNVLLAAPTIVGTVNITTPTSSTTIPKYFNALMIYILFY
jgi:hypothetical protein